MLVKRTRQVGIVTLMVLTAWVVTTSGCKPEPVEWSDLGSEMEHQGYREIRIEAQSNNELADLTADNVIAVMDKIGFTPEQILDFGPAMRDALRKSGAARVIVGKRVEAILRVKGRLLFIQSNSRGSFIYDLERSRFGLM